MARHPTLTVAMIVKNEEKNLTRVLQSVHGLADEVIVVDTGSTDRSVEIARDFGARVFGFEWCDDFSAARNESLRHATGDYVLWLDGDDEVEPESARTIKEGLPGLNGRAAFLKLISLQERDTTEAIQLRLFPNGKGIRFHGRVHEQVAFSLEEKGIKSVTLDARIIHHGYERDSDLAAKLERNRRIHERELLENPDNVYARFFLARTLKGLKEHGEALAALDPVLSSGLEKMDPDVMVIAVLDKAEILCGLGRNDEAAALLESWKERLRRYDLLGFTLGEIYFKRGDYEAAYTELKPLRAATFRAQRVPVDVQRMQGLVKRYAGISALFAGDYPVAEECFTACIAANPEEDDAYHYLALTREKAGNLQGALRACDQGLARFHDDDLLKKKRFTLLVLTGDMNGAREAYAGLNGCRSDMDVLSGMFLVNCNTLNLKGIETYYGLLQKGLFLHPQTFPEGLAEIRRGLSWNESPVARRFFDAGISRLLQSTP